MLSKDTIKRYTSLLAKVVLAAGLVAVFLANNLPEARERIQVNDTVALTHEVFGNPVQYTEVATDAPEENVGITIPEQTESAVPSESTTNSEEYDQEIITEAPQEERAPFTSASSENTTSAADLPQSSPENANLININTASKSELMQLNGIGEVKAQAIIDYRESFGGFLTVDEITLVSGIGEKTLEKNRDRITV